MTEEPQSQGSEPAVPGDLVTESLLSWAKDVRYVGDIQDALRKALEPHSSYPEIETKTWYLAYLLYVLTVIRQKGRSLGMEATGLQFVRTRIYPVVALTALGVGSWALHGFYSEPNRPTTPEELRGTDRQRRHELLRQQMLERSSAGSQLSSQQQQRRSMETDRIAHMAPNNHQGRMMSALKHSVRAFIRSFIQTVRQGPHTVVSSSDGSRSPPVSILTWILRLYMAQYLITGKHPTMVHRILGLQHERQTKSSRVSVEPGGHRMVALLIALQGSAALERFCLKVWTNRVALHLEKKKPYHTDDETSSVEITTGESYALSLCAICRTPRVRPAASRTCGHVFCWSCLSHWVSSVKEACPYCRSPCRMDDIQPLYNYDQPLLLEGNKK
jgi:hypothetical protein